MCYKLRCDICGKTAWGGCGRHLESIKVVVHPNNRCMHVKWD